MYHFEGRFYQFPRTRRRAREFLRFREVFHFWVRTLNTQEMFRPPVYSAHDKHETSAAVLDQ